VKEVKVFPAIKLDLSSSMIPFSPYFVPLTGWSVFSLFLFFLLANQIKVIRRL